MQLQDLENYYIEALSLHTLFKQMGFVQDQLLFVPEHLNVGMAIMDKGRPYQFNCCYLEACYRREDVIAGWPHAVELWYGEKPLPHATADDFKKWETIRLENTKVRWGLVFDSAIYRYLDAILDVLVAKGLLDYPRKDYVNSIEGMKAYVIGCHKK